MQLWNYGLPSGWLTRHCHLWNWSYLMIGVRCLLNFNWSFLDWYSIYVLSRCSIRSHHDQWILHLVTQKALILFICSQLFIKIAIVYLNPLFFSAGLSLVLSYIQDLLRVISSISAWVSFEQDHFQFFSRLLNWVDWFALTKCHMHLFALLHWLSRIGLFD